MSTTRRDFLARTAALATTGALLPSVSAATARHLPAPRLGKRRQDLGEGEPIRVGVIGTGGMGSGHTEAFTRLNRDGRDAVQVVGLCDVNKVRLDATAKRLRDSWQPGVEFQTHADHRELLARDDVHGVLVASPEHWHAPMAIDAMLAGKDIYLEKPMTLRLDEALSLREWVQSNPETILQVGTQKMMLDKYQRATALIAAGRIGKPTLSQTSYCRNSPSGEWNYYHVDPAVVPGPNLDWDAWCGPLGRAPFDGKVYARWRRYRKYSTGIIGDLLVHEMTPLMMALDQGWPVRVTASGGHYVDKAMENHDQVLLTVELEQQHTMVVAGSTCNEQGLETIIRGHDATLYMGGSNCTIRPERHMVDEIDEETFENQPVRDQDELRLDWLRSIRTREPNRSRVDLATQVMVAVDLATRSLWDGRTWRFDPETMTANPA